MKLSVKKPNAFFWKCGLSREEVYEWLQQGKISEEWLICPLSEANRHVTLAQFLADPNIFTPPPPIRLKHSPSTPPNREKLLPEVPHSSPASELKQLLSFLSDEDASRFNRIRERSQTMTQLQRSMHNSYAPAGEPGFKTESLEKLLWLFLKLLHNRTGIDRFLSHISREQIENKKEATETKLADARRDGASERLITPLEDKLQTLSARLQTHDASSENLLIVEAELDKTEQLINHICEIGMTNQDGSELSSQIDGVVGAIRRSEAALLSFDLSGIFNGSDQPPPLISAQHRLLDID